MRNDGGLFTREKKTHEDTNKSTILRSELTLVHSNLSDIFQQNRWKMSDTLSRLSHSSQIAGSVHVL